MNTAVNCRTLTAEDRCDICRAPAMVIAVFVNGELLFCGHHARVKHKSLKEKAINIYDPENKLNSF